MEKFVDVRPVPQHCLACGSLDVKPHCPAEARAYCRWVRCKNPKCQAVSGYARSKKNPSGWRPVSYTLVAG